MARKLKLKQGGLSVRGEFQPSTVDIEKRTVELVWTTGARVLRYDWLGNRYYEELSTDATGVKLERLNLGAPFLKDHFGRSIDFQVGVVLRAWMENGIGKAVVQISNHHPDAERIFGDIVDGVLRNISVGYDPIEYTEMPPTADGIPVYRANLWEPYELSIVAIPADAESQFRTRSESKEAIEVNILQESNTTLPQGEKSMDPVEEQRLKDEADAKAKADAMVTAERKKAVAEEKTRQGEIRSAVKLAKLDDAVAEELVSSDVTIEKAREMIFARMAAKQPVINPNEPTDVADVETREQRNDAIVTALLHRSNIGKVELTERAREFRGVNLSRLAEDLLRRSGVKTSHMSVTKMAQRALSSGDLPILLGNVASKVLRSSYELQQPTFWPFTTKGSLPDFKESSRIQFGDAANLKLVPEGDVYEESTVGEGAEKIKVQKFGRLLAITMEMIVNDDIDGFLRLPKMFGAAAARAESKSVYDILVNNPNMADGVALFNGTHGNIGTGGALTETTLAELEKLLIEMKTVDKLDFLDLKVANLIVGSANKVAAQKLLGLINPTQASNVNPYSGAGINLIVDPRMTGTKYVATADKSQVDMIELAYLEGEDGPEITENPEYKSDSVVFKVRHIFGTKAIDYRGLAYNAGV